MNFMYVIEGPNLVFSPAVLTFEAGDVVLNLAVIANSTIGSSRISFLVFGPNANAYAFKDDVIVTIIRGNKIIFFPQKKTKKLP